MLDAQSLAGAGKKAGTVGTAVIGQHPLDTDPECGVVGNGRLQKVDGRGFLLIRSEEVKAWQSRPLDPLYPIIYLDCIHVKVREGAVRVKAVYLAIGVTMTGEKEVLGLWLAQTEGAKFWLQVVTELRNRGVQDIFIACVDGLKGFPEAIEAVFPRAAVQLCIVHMVRHSLNYVSWKRRP